MGTVRVKTVYVESQLSTKVAGFQNIISHLLLGILGAQDTFLQQSSAGSFQQFLTKRGTTNTQLSCALSSASCLCPGCLLGLSASHVQWDRSALSPLPALRGGVELGHHRHCSEVQCSGVSLRCL